MEFGLRHPFRVLGLPATESSREIAKRVSDLEQSTSSMRPSSRKSAAFFMY